MEEEKENNNNRINGGSETKKSKKHKLAYTFHGDVVGGAIFGAAQKYNIHSLQIKEAFKYLQ